MTDREILELAAKAVGYEIHKGWQAEREALGHGDAGLWIRNGSTCWNLLTTRQDAFSLVVKLKMTLSVSCSINGGFAFVDVTAYQDFKHVEIDEQGPADQAEQLTMRAITRCAAEVGRAMG